MKIYIHKILQLVGFTAFASVFIIVPWYIFGDLKNPLEFMQVEGFLAFLLRPLFSLVGLLVYIMAALFIYLVCQVQSRIILIGWKQFIAEEKEEAAIAKKNSTRDAGTFVAVSADNAGLLDYSTTLIETTEGFYRVFGKVDKAMKGDKVIIEVKSTGMVGFEVVHLSGKEYQLTN